MPYVKYEVTRTYRTGAPPSRQGAESRGRALAARLVRELQQAEGGAGKEAMQYIDYVECFPNGVYQNAPDGRADVTKPDAICEGYTSRWPLWVVPKDGAEPGDEIGIQGQIKKPKELQRLIKEAKGDKFDPVAYFTTGGDGYVSAETKSVEAEVRRTTRRV